MSNTVVLSSIPAAWYPDPSDDSRVRWWDGEGWTDTVTEAPVEFPVMTVVPAPRHHPDSPPVLEPQKSTSVILPQYAPDDSDDAVESLYTPPPRYALPPHERFRSTLKREGSPPLGLTLVPPAVYPSTSQRNRDFVPVYDFAPPPATKRAATVTAWCMAFLPALHFFAIWLTTSFLRLELDDLAKYALFAAPIPMYLVLALGDRKKLILRDFENPPSPFVAVVPPIYFVLRAIRVGRSSLITLLVWLVLEIAAAGGLIWLGTISPGDFGL